MPLLPPAALGGVRGAPGLSTAFTANSALAGHLPEVPEAASESLIPAFSRYGDFLQLCGACESFDVAYHVGQKIGEGGFGKVFQATHKVLGVSRAVKRLKKSKQHTELRKNELAALLALFHPHIVKLIEYFDEENYLYLVFDLCSGPDLLDRIQQAPGGRLSELDASVALRHILKALQCCHSQYRGHYDIKPENFMYADTDCHDLMMIDLGLSSGFDRQRKHKIKGTAAYMAPEFWDGIYGPEGDIWSCGVVLFVMLTGTQLLPNVPPAVHKRETKCRALLRESLHAAYERFGISEEAQDLLSSMLQHDRHARPTVREAFLHPFSQRSYMNEIQKPRFVDAQAMRERLIDTFRAVAREPALKRVARLAMAHASDLSVQELAVERFLFRTLDRHGYGELSVSVLEKDFTANDMPIPEDFDEIFDAMDMNRDGYISYVSFLSIMLPLSLRSNSNLCRVAFSFLDRGCDGYICCDDLAATFGHEQDSEVPKNILAEISAEDSKLSWEGFVDMMGGECLS